MILSWISAGVSSFIASYLIRDSIDKFIYIHIDDHHSDSLRFIKDCEKLLEKPIEIIQSKYKSVNQACSAFGYINGAYGAKCTDVLKKRVRKEWERQQTEPISYVWGFDLTEKHRADRLNETMKEFKHIFPLIERQLTKQDCHAILVRLGIKRPVMYDMGYHNNNCIGCVKGGKGYWNKIRKDFPDVFKSRMELEELVGNSCIKGCFLKDLKEDEGREQEPISEECSIFCEMNL